MALTPAEEAELEEWERTHSDHITREFGDTAAEEHINTFLDKDPRETSDFSFMRGVILGPIRDDLENILEFGRAVVPVGTATALGPVAGAAVRANLGEGEILPQLEGTENAGTAEAVTRSILGYLVPFTQWSKVFKVGKAATFLSRTGRAAMAGAATTLTTQDPVDGNVANTLKDTFGVDNEWLDAISSQDGEDALAQRLKAAATDAGLGIVADSVFKLGGKLAQLYKRSRGEASEAKDIIEALQHDYSVKAAELDQTADDIVEVGVKEEPVPSTDPFDPKKHVGIENQPESWEDVLNFLTRQAGKSADEGADILDETLAAIAQGDPDNVLARSGINPKNLNWSDYETPEAVRNLHAALTDASERIARGLGRTGERLSKDNLYLAARSLASDVEVLKTLYGSTSRLPEILTGARMLVGSHARVLLDDAKAALDALMKDGGGQEWNRFLRTFHRHALYVGSVRGAGSEIGRALNSLRLIIKAGDESLALKEAERIKGLADGPVTKFDPKQVADEELNSVMSIDNDAERIALLSRLLEKDGDIGALAQFVRQKNGSLLKRADAMTIETLGNLFSAGTAAYNVKSTFTVLGLRALAKWASAAYRTGLAPFSRYNSLQARISRAEAWAYTDGIVMAWNDAVSNAMAVMEKEGAAEVMLHADTLGMKKLAKKAARVQAQSAARQKGNFERVDLEHSPKALSLNPHERRALKQYVETYNLPKILDKGINTLARMAGTALNTVGTLTRTGTILFINAPDQFAGTFAARAGAQAAAVREAVKQAAEYGLEGKELSQFLKARVASLSTDVTGWHDQAFEQGFRETVYAAGEQEAREVLFQDPLETKFSRQSEKLRNSMPVIGPLLVAFVHTPLRIIERTAFDFTPLGVVRKRFQDAVVHGSPQQRDQAIAQMAFGTFAMYLGYRYAEDHTIVGADGGFASTGRLTRERYSLRAGGDVYEFVREDPLGSLLGIGADLRAYLDHASQDPNADQKNIMETAWDIFAAGSLAFAANMLSKTWFESIQKLTQLVEESGQCENCYKSALQRYVQSFGRRVMPGAGVQKSIEGVYDPYERAALTFTEKALQSSLGATTLPIKRDFRGNPIRKNLGERFTGLTWEPEKTDKTDRALADLSIRANMPSRTFYGVQLTSEQYNRLLDIRGNEVVLPKWGGTLNETLDRLVAGRLTAVPWKSLRREAKTAAVRKVFEGYTHEANKVLLTEYPELHAKALRNDIFEKDRAQNLTDDRIEQHLAQVRADLGLDD